MSWEEIRRSVQLSGFLLLPSGTAAAPLRLQLPAAPTPKKGIAAADHCAQVDVAVVAAAVDSLFLVVLVLRRELVK